MPYIIIAIIPPEEQTGYLRILQKMWNKKYGTSDALNYPPHITLKGLGEVDEKKLNIVYAHARKIAEKTRPFQIHVDGIRFFGTDENYPGIYLGVEKSKGLKQIHEVLVKKLKKFEDKPRQHKELENYNPHLTFVGTDIDEEAYERAKKEITGSGWLPKFSFDADKIYVLQRAEDLGEYGIAKEFDMQNVSVRFSR